MIFSVLNEPLIPIVLDDGTEKNVGLRDAIVNAHAYKDIGGANPLERYSLLRLLIAFAMDMCELHTSADRRRLLKQRHFSQELFDAYVEVCENGGEKFDLFDDEHPFLQSAYDEKIDYGTQKPVASIFHTLPSGNNHVFRDHRMQDQHAVSIAEAFRAMCTAYTFCQVGGKGYTAGINGTPPLYVIIKGESLFETIVYNMVSEKECGNIVYGLGTVPWRTECNTLPKKEYASITELQGLTWMPRRTKLILDNDRLVRNIYHQQGHVYRNTGIWVDPHVPYCVSSKDTFVPVEPKRERALWRDVGTVIYDTNSKTNRQSLNLQLVSSIVDEEMPAMLKLRITGLSTNKATLYEWQELELSLPGFLFDDFAKAELFRNDILTIEKIYNIIGNIYSYKEVLGDSKKKTEKLFAMETIIQSQTIFLKLAHDVLFGDILSDIADCPDGGVHITALDRLLKPIVSKIISETINKSSANVSNIFAQTKAAEYIWKWYNREIKRRRDEYA